MWCRLREVFDQDPSRAERVETASHPRQVGFGGLQVLVVACCRYRAVKNKMWKLQIGLCVVESGKALVLLTAKVDFTAGPTSSGLSRAHACPRVRKGQFEARLRSIRDAEGRRSADLLPCLHSGLSAGAVVSSIVQLHSRREADSTGVDKHETTSRTRSPIFKWRWVRQCEVVRDCRRAGGRDCLSIPCCRDQKNGLLARKRLNRVKG